MELYEVIREYEERLTLAEREGDEAVLRELLADSFTGINMRGMRVDAEGFIFGLCKAEVSMESLKIDDLQISLYGTLAVVVGKSHFKAIYNSEQIEGTAQYMDVWTKEDHKWKLQNSSVTPSK